MARPPGSSPGLGSEPGPPRSRLEGLLETSKVSCSQVSRIYRSCLGWKSSQKALVVRLCGRRGEREQAASLATSGPRHPEGLRPPPAPTSAPHGPNLVRHGRVLRCLHPMSTSQQARSPHALWRGLCALCPTPRGAAGGTLGSSRSCLSLPMDPHVPGVREEDPSRTERGKLEAKMGGRGGELRRAGSPTSRSWQLPPVILPHPHRTGGP